jgi:hypothetical protein
MHSACSSLLLNRLYCYTFVTEASRGNSATQKIFLGTAWWLCAVHLFVPLGMERILLSSSNAIEHGAETNLLQLADFGYNYLFFCT